jgi:hypothetical protein
MIDSLGAFCTPQIYVEPDLSAFHIPIAVIIAYIVKTVLKQWKQEGEKSIKRKK